MNGSYLMGRDNHGADRTPIDLSQIPRGIAPVVVRSSEMKSIIVRCGLTIAALAGRMSMDPKTLRARCESDPVPIGITKQVREIIGAAIFDEALAEIRNWTVCAPDSEAALADDDDGQEADDADIDVQRGPNFLTGRELTQILTWRGQTQVDLARIVGLSSSTVGRWLAYRYHNVPLPLVFVSRYRKSIGEEEFDEMVYTIRQGIYDQITRSSILGRGQS